MKKLAVLIKSERFPESKRFPESEEGNVETDKIEDVSVNKTVTLIKKVKDCKPFVTSSILFLCVSIILIRIMVYFCLKLKNNVLPY